MPLLNMGLGGFRYLAVADQHHVFPSSEMKEAALQFRFLGKRNRANVGPVCEILIILPPRPMQFDNYLTLLSSDFNWSTI